MDRGKSPYRCHVFVCTNDRQGRAKACADGKSLELKENLKTGVAARGWQGLVRISSSGCMGLCQKGPNVMIYPQGLWFGNVAVSDAESILEEVSRILGSA